jgi:hypothetical protein
MKKLILFTAVAFAGLTMTFTACQKEESSQNKLEKSQLKTISTELNMDNFDDYITFGNMHNQSLEYYYNRLTNNPNESQYLVTTNGIVSGIHDYFDQNGMGSVSANFSNSFSDLISKFQLNSDLSNLRTNYTNGINSDIQRNLTAVQNEYFSILYKTEDFQNADAYNQTVTNLMNNLKLDNRLSSRDKQTIYLAASIGISSFKYWEDNHVKWQTIAAKNIAGRTATQYWKEFTKADIGGAITGGIGGAFAGAVTVPGIGAVPGWVLGAVGGAIGGSVSWAIMDAIFG